ncbi:UNVERIFIED_CONTAM: D-xylose-proton symporter-like 3, chloroplastic [Sesamum angustifolium]|uniref:D-xylose-proton symporter-like 3, chloroplastic n=1 Tax=Sesamum angustifolium TaxID=2727405 RepID=A0AAW2IR85_9LAMI
MQIRAAAEPASPQLSSFTTCYAILTVKRRPLFSECQSSLLRLLASLNGIKRMDSAFGLHRYGLHQILVPAPPLACINSWEMALTCAPPLLNLKLKNKYSQHHFCVAKKSNSVASTPVRNSLNLDSDSRSFWANDRGFRIRFLRSAPKPNSMKVGASSGEGKSFNSEITQQEVFAWSSVILPTFFPDKADIMKLIAKSDFHLVHGMKGFLDFYSQPWVVCLFGYDIGATSGATISLQSPELSGTNWFNFSAVQLGLVVSGSLYGALAGSLIVYPLADFLGRRRELIIASLFYLIGALLTAYAPGLGVLLVARLLYGLGIGMAMHGAPLYIAETCPSQIRGTLISLKELFIVMGILLGYFVGNFEINAIGGWRYMYGFSAPIALLMGLGMWSLPPSPRWLLLRAVQGKGSLQEYKEKALLALRKLRGWSGEDKVSERQIEDTLVSLKTAYADNESEGSFLEVFQGPSLKAFIIGGGLVLFQQITGQPSVLYYAGPILQTAGFSAAADATKLSVVIGVFKLLMTGVAVLKVDDLGRRPLLIGGVAGLAFSLLLLSAYYKFLGGFPFVAVAALLLYVGCYQISFGPISWLMVSEIFPLRTRGKGISLAVLTNFGSNAIVTFAFSPLKELLGAENLFLLFGAIAVLSLVFAVTSVPETKGLSLEEIESKILK